MKRVAVVHRVRPETEMFDLCKKKKKAVYKPFKSTSQGEKNDTNFRSISRSRRTTNNELNFGQKETKRASQEEQNGANFSFIAPSTEE